MNVRPVMLTNKHTGRCRLWTPVSATTFTRLSRRPIVSLSVTDVNVYIQRIEVAILESHNHMKRFQNERIKKKISESSGAVA